MGEYQLTSGDENVANGVVKEPELTNICLADETSLPHDFDLESEARAKANAVLAESSLRESDTTESSSFGNKRDFSLFESVRRLREEVQSLLQWKKDEEIRDEDRAERIAELTATSKGYLDNRNRFLDVYRRDIRHDLPLSGSPPSTPITPAILTGNHRAHSGDAYSDAIVYRDGRKDNGAFDELYGFNFKEALYLRK